MPIIKREIRLEDIGFINKVFDHYDEESKGYLTMPQLKFAQICVYGRLLLKEEKRKIREQSDIIADGQQAMTRSQFVEVMLTHIATTRVDEDIRIMFKAMDLKDRGYLVVDDLLQVFNTAVPHGKGSSKSFIKQSFDVADVDGDGRVTFRDFEFIMACNLDT